MSAANTSAESGPVVFAYDGSELANLAIDKAGTLLADKRDALVVCVWQPFDVGFVVPDGIEFNAAQTPAVKQAAELTAAGGAARAEAAGFKARSIAVEAAPTWKGIVKVADEHDASRDRARLPWSQRLRRSAGGQRRRRGRIALAAGRC